MPYALSQTYAYPLVGQTSGSVVAEEMPLDPGHDLPTVGYTGAYGRKISEMEQYAMTLTPSGRVFRAVRVKIMLPFWNAPPSNFEELETSALLYADFPSQTIEDHLRKEGMHINGYTLDQAVSHDPSIIDRIATHPAYASIRGVVWYATIAGKITKLITLTDDSYVDSVQCAALPNLRVELPKRRIAQIRRRRAGP
jgi:hypothetical protein